MNQYQYEVGDIVKLKKPHPCGSHEWEILRVGADFRLKCTGCGHQMMVTRKLVEKNTRGLRKPEYSVCSEIVISIVLKIASLDTIKNSIWRSNFSVIKACGP